MKNLTTSGEVQKLQKLNLSFEHYIEERHTSFLNEKVLPQARDDGKNNSPNSEETNPQAYTGFIVAEYECLVDENKKVCKPKKVFSSHKDQEAKFERDKKASASAIVSLDEKIRTTQIEFNRMNKSGLEKEKRWRTISILGTGVVVGDAIFISVAFQAMGLGLLFSLLVGLIFGVILWIYCEKTPDLIGLGKTRSQKTLIVLLMLAFLGIVFYILGIFRLMHFGDSVNIFNAAIKPIFFVILNYFIAIAGMLISYFNKPTKAECEQVADVLKKEKELKELIVDRKNIINEMKQSERDYLTNRELAAEQLEVTENNEAVIMRYFAIAYYAYMRENSNFRSTKLPVFFSYKIPEIKTYFQNK